jgi:hypothetical protein
VLVSCLDVIEVVVVEDVLVRRIPKEPNPFIRLKVGQFGVRGNGGEPIIKHDMKLGCDCSRVHAEDKGNSAGVHQGVSHVHGALGAGLPTGNLLAVSDCRVQDVDRATPNVKVMELPLFPSGSSENVTWGDSSVQTGDMIVQEDGVLNGHGPESGLGHVGPVNSCVQHHGA